MTEITITYLDKEYKVNEPTIEMWTRLAVYKDILDDSQFLIKVISESTGLSDKSIMKADWYDIMLVGNTLSDYLINQTQDFENEFDFKGKRYRFIDLPNLSFGEFVDIDTLLSKTEIERKSQLPLLMAMLYRPLVDGKLEEYDAGKVQERAELFKELPIRYVHGALGFFLHLEKMLQRPSLRFLVKAWKVRTMKKINQQKKKVLRHIGGGLEFLRHLPTKILRR